MCPTPTQTVKADSDPPAQRDPVQHSKYAFAAANMLSAANLLSTITLTAENIKEWAILDSGATSHFLVLEAPTRHTEVATNPLIVRLPDGARVKSTHTCELELSQLPPEARIGHIVLGLASHSLLSVVKLSNAGCTVEFTKIGCTVRYRGKIVLRGHKCLNSGLWMVNLKG